MVLVERAAVEKILNEALALLRQCDAHLLRYDVSERAICFRLGLYLQHMFTAWDVDCEYNRDGHDPKQLHILPRDQSILEEKKVSVFPDIIVHRRGTAENLLIVEVKKSNNNDRQAYHFDQRKLRGYKDQLGYSHGVFLEIPVADHFEGLPSQTTFATRDWY